LKSGKIHEYPSPEETPALMSDLIDWYRKHVELMHPVQLAAEFHYRFVCIHPFDDGNGRVARLAMNYILLRNGYPPVIIKSDDKERYLTALQKADVGDRVAIVEYVERQAIWSLELNIKAARGADIEDGDDLDKEIEILKRRKLSNEKVVKSVKVVGDVIEHIDQQVWSKIEHLLQKFDEFFVRTNLTPLGDKPKGDNYCKTRILKGLRSANRDTDIVISCCVSFFNASYQLSVNGEVIIATATGSSHTSKIIFELENDYQKLFLSDEINSIAKLVSKYMIENIDSLD
ncbi:MAG: Fic family protein, partial [Bacteroidota bacterium]